MFKMPKSTGDLFTELKDDKNLNGYLQRNREEFVLPLGEYLEKLLAQKNLTKKEVIARSDLNREYVYHIFSGLKKIHRAQKFWQSQWQWNLIWTRYNICYATRAWVCCTRAISGTR